MANGKEEGVSLPLDLDAYADRKVTLVVSGSDKVYVGEQYGGRPQSGGFSVPQFKDRARVAQEGFAAIVRDPNLYSQMSQAYNIYNGKKINAQVNPDDLERFYSDAAYDASQRDPKDKVTTLDVIFGRLPSPEVIAQLQEDEAGRGPGGYRGPVAQITEMAESDIRKSANTIALELLGRPVDEKEMDRIVRKMRSAEQKQPTVTTAVPGRTVTQQGLTAQGREDILRDLISDNPEYEQFQVNTTVLDSMLDFVNRKKQVSGG
jgi:hypothetical protein